MGTPTPTWARVGRRWLDVGRQVTRVVTTTTSRFASASRTPPGPAAAAVREASRRGYLRPGCALAAATDSLHHHHHEKSFESLGLSGSILEALDEIGLDSPSEIQAKAIEGILRGGPKMDALGQNGILLASQTGSGKTLAYLLPIVQQIKQWEEYEGRSKPKRPRCIVVAPTQELVEQIHAVAKTIGHVVKFSSSMASARAKIGQQKKALERPTDVLVGTPNRILRLNREGHAWFGDCAFLVLDECDLLLGEDYVSEVSKIVQPVVTKERRAKVVMVTASATKRVRTYLRENLGGGIEAETEGLHRAVGSARHHFIAQGQNDKLELLEQTVLPHVSDLSKNAHGLVFCNTLDSCRAVEHYMQNNGFRSFCLHGSVPNDQRKGVIGDFLGSQSGILITTDLAARGLDFGGKVKYVVNFDFPHSKVDYLHRTGRTARANAAGKVYSLVRGRDRRLAKEIELAVGRKETIEEKPLHRAATRAEGDRGARGKFGGRGGGQGRGRGAGRRGGGPGEGRGRRDRSR